MKHRKYICFICCIVIITALGAFTVAPRISLIGNESTIDAMYLSAVAQNDILTVEMEYNSNGKPFEILKDVSVATQGENEKDLKLIRSSVNNGKYVYEFDYRNAVGQKVSVKPPVLYTPTQVTSIKTELEKGNVVKKANEEWFIIENIEIFEKDGESSCVKVSIVPKIDTIPRLPKLMIEDKEFGGLTVMYLDKEGEFCSGDIFFYVPENECEGKTMSIVLNSSLERLEAKKVLLTSEVKTLTVQEK